MKKSRQPGRPRGRIQITNGKPRNAQLNLRLRESELREWELYRAKTGKSGPDALMDAIRNPVAPKP